MSDWEEVRINAAINAMNSLLSSSIITFLVEFILRKGVAKVAVKYADELIEELKKEENMDEKDLGRSEPIYDEVLTLCACNSSEHQMIWRADKDCEDGSTTVYCDIHLIPLRWYERLWQAVKYVFGYTSKYGDFEEYIFRRCDIPKFEKLLEVLNESCV